MSFCFYDECCADHGFIARVLKISPGGESEFLGTGIAITSDQVLTCRHVVVERDIRGLYADEALAPEKVMIQYGDNTETITSREIITDTRWDLALLKLTVSIAPPFPSLHLDLTVIPLSILEKK